MTSSPALPKGSSLSFPPSAFRNPVSSSEAIARLEARKWPSSPSPLPPTAACHEATSSSSAQPCWPLSPADPSALLHCSSAPRLALSLQPAPGAAARERPSNSRTTAPFSPSEALSGFPSQGAGRWRPQPHVSASPSAPQLPMLLEAAAPSLAFQLAPAHTAFPCSSGLGPDAEHGPVSPAGDGEAGANWRSSTERHTLPCVQQLAGGERLRTRGGGQRSAATGRWEARVRSREAHAGRDACAPANSRWCTPETNTTL